MNLKKYLLPIILALFILAATFFLYDYKITLEQEIENAFTSLYQTGNTHLFFDDDVKMNLNAYFSSLKASGLIDATFSAFRPANSETIYVLIKSAHEDGDSLGIGYLIFDLDERQQVNNLIISSWVRIASDKDNF